jgi:hypothetical protein
MAKHDNAIIFDHKIDTNNPDFNQLLSDLYNDYLAHMISIGEKWVLNSNSPKHEKHKKALRSIISNCYLAWTTSSGHHKTAISYSRSSNTYTSYPFTLDTLKSVIDWLINKGFVSSKLGYFCSLGSPDNFDSRLSYLKNLNNCFAKLKTTVLLTSPETKLINIKDHQKKDNIGGDEALIIFDMIDFYETGTSELQKQVEINTLRKNTIVMNENKSIQLSPYHRTLNNSCFGDGGRVYGCPIQNMPKKIRSSITINNNPIVEMDYSNLHLNMIYHLSGKIIKGDAYQQGILKKYCRKLIKTSIFRIINSANLIQAKRSMQKYINENPIYIGIKPQTLIDDIQSEHWSISSWFCSGKGIKLQHIDSIIALEIMHYFCKKNIVCLSIHDSFIVEKQYQDELIQVMLEKYDQCMKRDFIIQTRERSKPSNEYLIEVKAA